MRTAAELNRELLVAIKAAHADDANFIAVFLAEQRTCACFLGVIHRHHACDNRRIGGHFRTHIFDDLCHLFRANRIGLAEIEAQAVGFNQRAFLRDMIA